MFNNKLKLLQSTIQTQQATIDRLNAQIDLNQQNLSNYESTITELRSQLSKLTELDEQIKLKQSELSKITNELSQKENEIYLTSLSFFNLEYNSQHYKDELKSNRLKQKQMLLNKEYFTISDTWYINNSKKDGNKLATFLVNLCINSFNQLSDATMKSVNVANYQSLYNKLSRAYKNYNDNLTNFNILFNESYLRLKLEELELNRNIDIKLAEEKEELAREKEILREQLRVERELEKEREKLEQALSKYQVELLDGVDVQDKIDEIIEKLGDNNKLLNGKKSGFVYIVSNVSLGRNVYKIGVTKRPIEDRLSELSSASVPFLFKPHCVIFSDDCYKLESELHNYFTEYRVNKINMRKEYFKLPLSEIERVIKEKYDPHAIFDYEICDQNFIASNYILSDNFVDKDVQSVL